MAGKSEMTVIIILVVAVLLVGMFLQKNYQTFSILGSETMTRDIPTNINPGSTFTITYTAIGTSGTWGASIIDNVAGGCKFPDGTNQLKTVMLSSDGNTKSVSVTAPSSGTCTFTGDSKFGTNPIVVFSTATTSISGTCTPSCTGKVCGDNGCGGSCGTCSSGVCSSGQCISQCPTGQIKCSDGACKETCESGGTGWCSFAEKIGFIGFMDNKCTEGNIILGIIGFVILLLISKR